jgi:vacuolar-type H+-ATPase catalytic subunit A/Vma1
MLRIMSKYSDLIQKAIDNNVSIEEIISLKSRESIARMGTIPNIEFEKKFKIIENELDQEIDKIIKEVK